MFPEMLRPPECSSAQGADVIFAVFGVRSLVSPQLGGRGKGPTAAWALTRERPCSRVSPEVGFQVTRFGEGLFAAMEGAGGHGGTFLGPRVDSSSDARLWIDILHWWRRPRMHASVLLEVVDRGELPAGTACLR